MTSHTSDNDSTTGDFDLSHIFIGREQQLDLYQLYLDRWKRLMNAPSSLASTSVNGPPSPNNKIQGLVVLLYGRGGFGKSTLLKHYHQIALEPGSNLTISKTIDWEFAIEGKRSVFNPPPGHEVDAADYFRVLCNQLTNALDKQPDQFREYKAAVEAVEDAHKQVDRTLHGLQQDDRFGWLRKMASHEIVALLRTAVPATNLVPGIDTIAKGTEEGLDQGIKVGAEQTRQLYTRLRDNLSHKLDDYLEPALKLGLSLGRDLARFARDFPLLVFFDTYEEIDEGDKLLRLVMGAAGTRVGWVIAGRDNLWAGTEQRKRSLDVEYGYKEIVPSDRGLAIDFNAGGIGAFTISDVIDYFARVREIAQYDPPLSEITEEQASQILEVTQGVPLAVKIAAGLYLDTVDLNIITAKPDGKREIVDQMVRRYLLHVHDNRVERARLYGLALLRRSDAPICIAAALGLTPEQAITSYESELSRLQRRYSFIFTEKAQPALHQEVRYFLRLWLLENYREPEIVAINERLKATHEAELKKLEERRQYSGLRERLEDEEWAHIYLDLIEQQFWLDPVEGVHYSLPFMIAAAIYRREVNREAIHTGNFFEQNLGLPYRKWWRWVAQSLLRPSSENPSNEALTGLEELTKLASQRHMPFPSSILTEDYHSELEAALWWRLGEAYQNKDNYKALEWYGKALTRLGHETGLKESTARTYYAIADKLYDEKKYAEYIPFLNRAVELKPDYLWAYTLRGIAYNELHDYQRAIADFDFALTLDPNDATAYYERGITYDELHDYQRAIANLDQALALNPNDSDTYYERGIVYVDLHDYQRAIDDFDQALALDPKSVDAYFERGIAYWNLKEYQCAIEDYNHTLSLDPNYTYAYSNRAIAYLWLKNIQQAIADYQRSRDLNPTDSNARWMIEWAEMGKDRIGMETAERLKAIAEIDSQDYVAYICRGVASGLQGKLNEGLVEIDAAIPLKPDEWDAYFWKGMICAYLGRNSAAIEAIEKALEVGLPPILLTQLYWLEQDRPDFFREYAEPLLKRYDV